MSTVLRVTAVLLTAVLLGGCAAAGPAPASGSSARHIVGLGLESLFEVSDWDALSDRLNRADVDELNLAVGRLDWLGYPPDSVGLPSGPVRESGRDFIAEALAGLRPWRDAAPDRRITLTIDALIPDLIKQRPQLAAVTADGERTDEFASVTALQGEVGDDLAALAADVATRYRPDEIAVTELFVDHSFGTDDLASFRAFSGKEDWPRRSGGQIDGRDPEIARWRSAAIADVVGRMSEQTSIRSVDFAVDVRVDWAQPARGRPDSGHDYAALLKRADRLVLWCYLGLEGQSPEKIRRVTAGLARAGIDPDRLVVSVGLWSEDTADEVLRPDTLRDAVRAGDSNGAGAVGATPLSLFQDEHWRALEEVWAPR